MGVVLLLGVVYLMTSVTVIKTSTNSRASKSKLTPIPTYSQSQPIKKNCTISQCGVYLFNQGGYVETNGFKRCCDGYSCTTSMRYSGAKVYCIKKK